MRFPVLPTKANIQSNSTSSSITRRQIAPVAAQTAANTLAITNISNQSVFLGNWSSTVVYQKSNQVLYSGGYYIALDLNSNAEPDTHPSDWQLITNQNSSVYEGPWSSVTAYAVGETVSYLGAYYICLVGNTNVAPNTSATDWTLLGSSSVLTGAWGSGASYIQNMQVTYNGNMYTALQTNTNTQPDTHPLVWQLVGCQNLDFLANGTIYIKGVGTVASESMTIENNNFEAASTLPVPGWQAVTATLNYEVVSPQSGNRSLQVNNTGYAETITTYACQPNDSFVVGGYAKNFDGVLPCYIQLLFLNAAGGTITALGPSTTSSSWTLLQATVTAPANSVAFKVVCLNGGSSSVTAVFDQITCQKVILLGTQVADGVQNFSATASTLTYRPTSQPLSATDAGGSATISVAAWVNRTSSKGDISYASGSVTGLSFSTLYFVYTDDGKLQGGVATYNATTTKVTAINGTGRFFIGSIITPASGGPQTSGNNDGGVGASFGQQFVQLGGTSTPTTSGGGSVTNANNAIDGNATTFAEITNGASAPSNNNLVVAGFSPFIATTGTATLNIRNSASNVATLSTTTVKMEYIGTRQELGIWFRIGPIHQLPCAWPPSQRRKLCLEQSSSKREPSGVGRCLYT